MSILSKEVKLSEHEQAPVRLVRIELRRFADNSTLALTPAGKMYHIQATPEEVHQQLQKCDGHQSFEAVMQNALPGWREVMDVLEADGCLRTSSPVQYEQDWVRFKEGDVQPHLPASTHIILVGDTHLIDMAKQMDAVHRFASVVSCTQDDLKDAIARYQGEPVLVVALRDRFDQDFLLFLNDFCEAQEVQWTQFHLDHGRGWLGPFVMPGNTTSDYRDVMGRRLTAAEDEETFKAFISPTEFGHCYVPPQSELMWMLTFFFVDIEHLLAGVYAHTLCQEVELNPVDLTCTAHPVLPLPHKHLSGNVFSTRVKQGYHLFQDDRTGIVNALQRIEHHPSIPAQLTTIQSHVATIKRLYVWANNRVCSGSNFGDLEGARNAAAGEALERYCGNWVQSTKLRAASYAELIADGEYALDPTKMVLYSEAQYDAEGFPFVRFTHDLKVHWVRGYSLTNRRPAWVPASFVYVNWYADTYKNDPPTNNLFYPGLAAGPSLEFALSSALEELIERDATMIWWTNAQPLPAVEMTPELAALWRGLPTELGQRAWLIHLDNEFGVPVMAGVVENVQEKLFNIGFAARPDPIDAAKKAWAEALTLQEGSRDLLEEHGLYREAVAKGQLNGKFIKPWRADRAYLDDYEPDFHDVNDLMCQQQIFLDPRAREAVRGWTDVPVTRTFNDLPFIEDRSMDVYQRIIEARGYEIFYVDVTTPDVALTGIRVVRAVVPGMTPNFPAAFPFLGQQRIQQSAVRLGWRSEPLPEEKLNYFPLPHA